MDGERSFDLNIEQVLENWTLTDAVREVIANALDEAELTGTRNPEISNDVVGVWHIRDYGRGLRYEHLTQNENQEKLDHPERVIGKFGVGLKDALATFDRHKVTVAIRSAHGDITTATRMKVGFEDIQTLHALIRPPSDPQLVGTDFAISGSSLTDDTIAAAKDRFLRYSEDVVIESTPLGQVVRRRRDQAFVYVNGLRVAEEENYLFSYNVTSLNAQLRRALNRERSNVGRSAYSDRVQGILLACEGQEVTNALVDDLARLDAGTSHEETCRIEVGLNAIRHLNARGGVIFLTAMDLLYEPGATDRARGEGLRVVVIPDTYRQRLSEITDVVGGSIRDLGEYRREWEDSFSFVFIDPATMTESEKAVWARLDSVFDARGGRPAVVRDVRISETMRLMPGVFLEAVGLWDAVAGSIIIKREQLCSMEQFAGTLLHETAHAVSGHSDVTRDFEAALTDELGRVVARSLG